MSDRIQPRLLEVCQQSFPDKHDIEVNLFTPIQGGWESDLYSFVLEHGPRTTRRREALILRIYPGDHTETKAAHEFDSLRRLYRVGYPVPQVFVLGQENSRLGKPFLIMEKIEGQEMWSLLSNTPQDKQRALLSLFCELFVGLHSLDWRDLADDPSRYSSEDPYFFIDRWTREARETLANSPYADFYPLVDWVENHKGDLGCPRPAPVHNDFHPNNILVRPDGSAVVIDWTGFHISDARFDLAWTLVLTSSYEGPQMREHILHEYERQAGAAVAQIECFEVIACARRLFDIIVSLSEGAERQGMRPEALTAMRQQARVTERVYDMLTERIGVRSPRIEELLRTLS